MRRIPALVLTFVVLAASGQAQELTLGISAYRPFGLDDLDGELPVSGELRLTLPISERFAIEPFVTAGKPAFRGRAEGFYGVQIRQRIGQYASGSAFATYGVAGYYSHWGVDAPIVGHFGVGVQHHFSKYLAFRPEVHLVTFHVVPVGARFVAGVSVGAAR